MNEVLQSPSALKPGSILSAENFRGGNIIIPYGLRSIKDKKQLCCS